MLKNVDKLLSGDLLKILCDMGHGDEIVIADANFPAHHLSKKVIEVPCIDGARVADAVLSVFPLDTYSSNAIVMDLTDEDKLKGMKEPIIWQDYSRLCDGIEKIERYAFYERASKAYAIIQTGEGRQYGNLILVKGVIL